MKNKMDKLTVILLISALSFNAFSLRCGNVLIEGGDSVYKVEQNCQIASDYRVQNANADIRHIVVDQGGMHYTIYVIDGVVNSIDGSR